MKLLQSHSRTKQRSAARQAMPALVAPMLAVLSKGLPPDPDHYAFEFKWDGVRAIWRWDGRRLSVQSRNQLDITGRYPELIPMTKLFGSRPVMLDGEVVALDDDARPSFPRLQRRMHVRDPHAVQRLMKDVPVIFVIFDVLWLDGRSLMNKPWLERRDHLEELNLTGPAWMSSPAQVGEGAATLRTATKMRLEGIVAKKLDSPYRAGLRSAEWLKVKIIADDEFVIGGWIPEAGTRSHRIGSLLIGSYDKQRRLHFAGGVGTGFNDDAHRLLTKVLAPLAIDDSPFADPIPKRGARFVKPKLVAQIEYRRIGPGGILHQAAYKGLRTDKSPKDLAQESTLSTQD